MSFSIRPAQPADASSLTALAIQVWLDTYAFEGVRPSLADYVLQTFTPQRFRNELADDQHQILVAEQAGHLIAYAAVRTGAACPSRPVLTRQLETLYVQPAFKGKGVGRALLQAAAGEGATPCWLNVWHGNVAALAFYRYLGCEQIGETWFELEGERHLNYVLATAGGGGQ